MQCIILACYISSVWTYYFITATFIGSILIEQWIMLIQLHDIVKQILILIRRINADIPFYK